MARDLPFHLALMLCLISQLDRLGHRIVCDRVDQSNFQSLRGEGFFGSDEKLQRSSLSDQPR
jgi:hypothetical protein